MRVAAECQKVVPIFGSFSVISGRATAYGKIRTRLALTTFFGLMWCQLGIKSGGSLAGALTWPGGRMRSADTPSPVISGQHRRVGTTREPLIRVCRYSLSERRWCMLASLAAGVL